MGMGNLLWAERGKGLGCRGHTNTQRGRITFEVKDATKQESNLEVIKMQKAKKTNTRTSSPTEMGRWQKPPCLSSFGMTPQRCILVSWPMLFFEAPLSPWVT